MMVQVAPMQAHGAGLGALNAVPAPAVLQQPMEGPAGVTCHHATNMPAIPAPLLGPAMGPAPSPAQGMNAIGQPMPCCSWGTSWLPSSAHMKLAKPNIPTVARQCFA